MRTGTNYLKQLIAACTMAGLLSFAMPASASSNSYTVYHCAQWEIDGVDHHMV
jgi:hypothetical protein